MIEPPHPIFTNIFIQRGYFFIKNLIKIFIQLNHFSTLP